MSTTDRSREPRPPRLAIPREQAAERLDRFLAEANAARETLAPAIRDLADLEEMGGGEWVYKARRHDLFRGEVSDKMKPIAELWARVPAAYDAHAQADRAIQDLRTSVNEFLLVAFDDDQVAGRFMRATGWYIGGQRLTLDQARQLESRVTAGISQLQAVRDSIEFYALVKDAPPVASATLGVRTTAMSALVEQLVTWGVRGLLMLVIAVALLLLGATNWDSILEFMRDFAN